MTDFAARALEIGISEGDACMCGQPGEPICEAHKEIIDVMRQIEIETAQRCAEMAGDFGELSAEIRAAFGLGSESDNLKRTGIGIVVSKRESE